MKLGRCSWLTSSFLALALLMAFPTRILAPPYECPLDRQLCLAAARGDLVAIKSLLYKGANAKVSNENGWTPLMSAARSGNIRVVKQLLDAGASVRQCHRHCSSTPLIQAADAGHLEVVKLLLKAGAAPNDFEMEKDSPTALTYAEKNGFT